MRTAAGAGAGTGAAAADYKYLIYLGNNSDLVRQTLARRAWWSTALDDEEDERGAMSLLLPSMLFGGPPRPDFTGHKLLADAALLGNAYDFCWRPTLGLKLFSGETVTLHSVEAGGGAGSARPPGRQLLNHFPTVRCIAAKNGLLRGLQGYYARTGIDVFTAVPTTYILRDVGRAGSAEFSRFCAHFRKLATSRGDAPDVERLPPKHCRCNLWIVKPSYLNQGQGIKVFSELTPLKDHLMGVSRDGLTTDSGTGVAVSAGAEWIVQKYVEHPLLVNGRKFDVRLWVVVTESFDVYVYPDGYIRTSSEVFTLHTTTASSGSRGRGRGGDHDAAQMIHLTNYCMQKHSSHLGAFEEGNTLSFEQMQTYLDAVHGEGVVSFRRDLLTRMRELVLDSVLGNRDALVVGGKGRHWFELFGYDFMIDGDMRTWLIEVNTNPYIDKQNPWHARLLQRMMEDMVALTIDTAFPPGGGGGGAAAGLPPHPTMLPSTLSLDALPPAAADWVRAHPQHLANHATFTVARSLAMAARAATAAPYKPLPAAMYDDAWLVTLPWKPMKRAAGSGGGAAVRAATGVAAAPADAAPLLGVGSDSKGDDDGGVAPATAGSGATAAGGRGGGSASVPAGWRPYRDPRINGWELIYTENPAIPVAAVPHQAAMAASAINATVVEACQARGGAPNALSLDEVVALGLPLRGATADGVADGGAVAGDGEASTPINLGPFTRRYIRRRDTTWLYPLGGPLPEWETAPRANGGIGGEPAPGSAATSGATSAGAGAGAGTPVDTTGATIGKRAAVSKPGRPAAAAAGSKVLPATASRSHSPPSAAASGTATVGEDGATQASITGASSATASTAAGGAAPSKMGASSMPPRPTGAASRATASSLGKVAAPAGSMSVRAAIATAGPKIVKAGDKPALPARSRKPVPAGGVRGGARAPVGGRTRSGSDGKAGDERMDEDDAGDGAADAGDDDGADGDAEGGGKTDDADGEVSDGAGDDEGRGTGDASRTLSTETPKARAAQLAGPNKGALARSAGPQVRARPAAPLAKPRAAAPETSASAGAAATAVAGAAASATVPSLTSSAPGFAFLVRLALPERVAWATTALRLCYITTRRFILAQAAAGIESRADVVQAALASPLTALDDVPHAHAGILTTSGSAPCGTTLEPALFDIVEAARAVTSQAAPSGAHPIAAEGAASHVASSLATAPFTLAQWPKLLPALTHIVAAVQQGDGPAPLPHGEAMPAPAAIAECRRLATTACRVLYEALCRIDDTAVLSQCMLKAGRAGLLPTLFALLQGVSPPEPQATAADMADAEGGGGGSSSGTADDGSGEDGSADDRSATAAAAAGPRFATAKQLGELNVAFRSMIPAGSKARVQLLDVALAACHHYKRDAAVRAAAAIPPLVSVVAMASPKPLSPWAQGAAMGLSAGAATTMPPPPSSDTASAEVGGGSGADNAPPTTAAMATVAPLPVPTIVMAIERGWTRVVVDEVAVASGTTSDGLDGDAVAAADAAAGAGGGDVVAAGTSDNGPHKPPASHGHAGSDSSTLHVRVLPSWLHGLRGWWAVSAAAVPATLLAQLVALRVATHLIAATRPIVGGTSGASVLPGPRAGSHGAAGAPMPPSPHARAAAASSVANAAVEASAAALRQRLLLCGLLPVVAAQSLVSNGPIHRACRDLLAYITPPEAAMLASETEIVGHAIITHALKQGAPAIASAIPPADAAETEIDADGEAGAGAGPATSSASTAAGTGAVSTDAATTTTAPLDATSDSWPATLMQTALQQLDAAGPSDTADRAEAAAAPPSRISDVPGVPLLQRAASWRRPAGAGDSSGSGSDTATGATQPPPGAWEIEAQACMAQLSIPTLTLHRVLLNIGTSAVADSFMRGAGLRGAAGSVDTAGAAATDDGGGDGGKADDAEADGDATDATASQPAAPGPQAGGDAALATATACLAACVHTPLGVVVAMHAMTREADVKQRGPRTASQAAGRPPAGGARGAGALGVAARTSAKASVSAGRAGATSELRVSPRGATKRALAAPAATAALDDAGGGSGLPPPRPARRNRGRSASAPRRKSLLASDAPAPPTETSGAASEAAAPAAGSEPTAPARAAAGEAAGWESDTAARHAPHRRRTHRTRGNVMARLATGLSDAEDDGDGETAAAGSGDEDGGAAATASRTTATPPMPRLESDREGDGGDAADDAFDRLSHAADALAEWRRRKDEEARMMKARAELEKAMEEAERAEAARARAERLAETRRRLADFRAKEAARKLERMRIMQQRARQSAALAAARAHQDRLREAGWVGLSSTATAATAGIAAASGPSLLPAVAAGPSIATAMATRGAGLGASDGGLTSGGGKE